MERAGPGDAAWTIDELAAEAGVPSRTIREYQRLELLPPPRRDGRRGRYGADHRARLAIVSRLQERGYSLAAIGDLMGSWEQGRGLGSVLGVDADPAVLDETPTEISTAQLRQLVPAFDDPQLVDDARTAGLIHRIDDEKVVVRSVAAIELVGLAIDAGMPPTVSIDLAGSVRAGAAAIASAAVDEFVEHLWPRRDDIDLAAVLSRARLLLAQASASLVVHELGAALIEQADVDEAGELPALIDRIAIGRVRRLGPTGREDQP
jgi:DNA-binding transcriptional MerR regulator